MAARSTAGKLPFSHRQGINDERATTINKAIPAKVSPQHKK